jgi:DNA-binding XRE family transcriptional regulator
LGACSAATERRKNSRRREPAASVCETREADEGEVMITAAHYKGARQLLGWSQSRLAGEAGISTTTVATVEGGERKVPALTVSTIRHALETGGVEFTNGGEPGVKLRKGK